MITKITYKYIYKQKVPSLSGRLTGACASTSFAPVQINTITNTIKLNMVTGIQASFAIFPSKNPTGYWVLTAPLSQTVSTKLALSLSLSISLLRSLHARRPLVQDPLKAKLHVYSLSHLHYSFSFKTAYVWCVMPMTI